MTLNLIGPTNDAAGFRSAIGLGDRNQPNGFAGLDSNGDLLGKISLVYDTYANISGQVLAAGQMAYATDRQQYFLGDGSTSGGVFQWMRPLVSDRNTPSGTTGPWLTFGADLTIGTLPIAGAGERWEMRLTTSWFSGTTGNHKLAVIDTGNVLAIQPTLDSLPVEGAKIENYFAESNGDSSVNILVDTLTTYRHLIVGVAAIFVNTTFATPAETRYIYQHNVSFTTRAAGSLAFTAGKLADNAVNVGVGWNFYARRLA